MWIGAVPERYAAAPAAGVGYPAREGLPGEGYPGKFTCPVHRPVVGADTVYWRRSAQCAGCPLLGDPGDGYPGQQGVRPTRAALLW